MFNTNDLAIDDDPEIEFLKRARHPRLVMFLGAGRMDTGNVFMIVEFCDQGDLAEYLYSSTAVPSWISRIELLVDVAVGLTYLHLVHDSVHRDLKSGNVLLATERKRIRAKIADFGTSKVLSRLTKINKPQEITGEAQEKNSTEKLYQLAKRSSISSNMTTDIGTILWMAPEVMAEKRIMAYYGQPIDVYSFSMIMYETLILGLPWSRSKKKFMVDIVDAVLAGKRPSVCEADVETAPEGFIALMHHCSSQQPDERPVIREIADRLHGFSRTLARGEHFIQTSSARQPSKKNGVTKKNHEKLIQKSKLQELEMKRVMS